MFIVYWCLIVKEHEVEKMFTLKSGRLPPADVKNIIFFVRPKLELMDIIAENVIRSVLYAQVWYFHVTLNNCARYLTPVFSTIQWRQAPFITRLPYFVRTSAEHAVWTAAKGARRLGLFHQHWRVYPRPDPIWWRPAVHGIWKCFQSVFDLHSYSNIILIYLWVQLSWCEFTPFCVVQECYLENDQTSLYHTAKGLMTLQALYGTIPQIYGKGDCARVSVVLGGVLYWFSEWHMVVL